MRTITFELSESAWTNSKEDKMMNMIVKFKYCFILVTDLFNSDIYFAI